MIYKTCKLAKIFRKPAADVSPEIIVKSSLTLLIMYSFIVCHKTVTCYRSWRVGNAQLVFTWRKYRYSELDSFSNTPWLLVVTLEATLLKAHYWCHNCWETSSAGRALSCRGEVGLDFAGPEKYSGSSDNWGKRSTFALQTAGSLCGSDDYF